MNDNQQLGSQLVMQRMNEIGQAIEQVRSAQLVASEHSRDLAVRMERIATNMEQVSAVTSRQIELEKRIEQSDIRLSLIEQTMSLDEKCVEESHEERITKIEHSFMKMAGMATIIIMVATYMAHVFLPK